MESSSSGLQNPFPVQPILAQSDSRFIPAARPPAPRWRDGPHRPNRNSLHPVSLLLLLAVMTKTVVLLGGRLLLVLLVCSSRCCRHSCLVERLFLNPLQSRLELIPLRSHCKPGCLRLGQVRTEGIHLKLYSRGDFRGNFSTISGVISSFQE